jgi:hypothetical protein
MKLVKIKLPVFNLERVIDKTDEEFVSTMEKSASMIIGEISDKKYFSHRAIGGTMTWFQVFEEMKVKYGDRKTPDKVLKSIEDKATS